MQCRFPIKVRDDHGFRFVPCGKCIDCLSRKHQQWQFRLQQEAKHSKCTYIVTLTYSDAFLPLDNDGNAHLVKSDVQNYMRKLRYLFGRSVKIRYFIVGEYGPQDLRPHYHGIIFFPNDYVTKDEFYMYSYNAWRKCEKFCLIVDDVSDEAINYCSKYVQKLVPVPEYLAPPFAICSRKPGIGASYLTPEIRSYHRRDFQTFTYLEGGVKVQLPRYYQDKLFYKFEKDIIRYRFLKEFYPDVCKFMDKYGDFIGCKVYVESFDIRKKKIIKDFKDKRKL